MGEKGQEVVSRLFAISRIFFFSWTLYPIFFLLSPQGLCAVGEKWIAALHMMADLLAKNTFGTAWPTANQRVCFLDTTATRASLTPLGSYFVRDSDVAHALAKVTRPILPVALASLARLCTALPHTLMRRCKGSWEKEFGKEDTSGGSQVGK